MYVCMHVLKYVWGDRTAMGHRRRGARGTGPPERLWVTATTVGPGAVRGAWGGVWYICIVVHIGYAVRKT